MSIKIATIAATLILGSALNAFALEGYDGDNNRIPGTAVTQSAPAAGWYARMSAGAKAETPSSAARSSRKASIKAAWRAWAERASQVH